MSIRSFQSLGQPKHFKHHFTESSTQTSFYQQTNKQNSHAIGQFSHSLFQTSLCAIQICIHLTGNHPQYIRDLNEIPFLLFMELLLVLIYAVRFFSSLVDILHNDLSLEIYQLQNISMQPTICCTNLLPLVDFVGIITFFPLYSVT